MVDKKAFTRVNQYNGKGQYEREETVLTFLYECYERKGGLGSNELYNL